VAARADVYCYFSYQHTVGVEDTRRHRNRAPEPIRLKKHISRKTVPANGTVRNQPMTNLRNGDLLLFTGEHGAIRKRVRHPACSRQTIWLDGLFQLFFSVLSIFLHLFGRNGRTGNVCVQTQTLTRAQTSGTANLTGDKGVIQAKTKR
jgi:hypothetical protein